MTETTLWIIESFIGGLCIGALIITAVWAWDVRGRDKKETVIKDEAYNTGFDEGYEVGGRLRFRERCQIARRCRQLEKMIQEETKR